MLPPRGSISSAHAVRNVMRNPLLETRHSDLYRSVWAVFGTMYVSDPCKVAPGHEDHIHEDVECA